MPSDGKFFYEDHGDNLANEQNNYTEKKFITHGNPKSMTMAQSWQVLFTPTYDTYQIQIIGLPFALLRFFRMEKR
jgi:alpha-glucosidase